MENADSTFMNGSSSEAIDSNDEKIIDLIYNIDERPETFYETIIYAWQHTLVDFTPFVWPALVITALGLPQSNIAPMVNACFLAMGLATLIQTTFGNRLPIIQGPSATVVPTMISVGTTFGGPAMWGAVITGGFVEALCGATGFFKRMKKLFPEVVTSVVIISIGIQLARLGAGWIIGDGSAINFLLSLIMFVCIFVLKISSEKFFGGMLSRGYILFSTIIVGLGISTLFGQVDWSPVSTAAWFAFPKLFPYGMPWSGWQFIPAAILGLFAGYIGSILESIGDYAATTNICDVEFKGEHIDRGIAAEGFGCVVASFFGALPVTSYTQNIGVIASTRIASRFVVQVSAILFILYSFIPKFGAIISIIPKPVLGALIVVMCGLISSTGISSLGQVNKSSVNQLISGITLILAICLPTAAEVAIPWIDTIPPLLRIMLTNGVIIAVVVGVLLNLILNIIFKASEKEDDHRVESN